MTDEFLLSNLFGPPITVPVPRRLLKTMSGDPFLHLKKSEESDHSPERIALIEAFEAHDMSMSEDNSSVCSSDIGSLDGSGGGSTCNSPVHMSSSSTSDDETNPPSFLNHLDTDGYYYCPPGENLNLFDLCDFVQSSPVEPVKNDYKRMKFSVWDTQKNWSELSSQEKRDSIYELSRVILEEMDVRQKIEISRLIDSSNNPSKIIIDLKFITNKIWDDIKYFVQKVKLQNSRNNRLNSNILKPKPMRFVSSHVNSSSSQPSRKFTVISSSSSSNGRLKSNIAKPSHIVNSNIKPVRLKPNHPRSLLRTDILSKAGADVCNDPSIKRISTFRKRETYPPLTELSSQDISTALLS